MNVKEILEELGYKLSSDRNFYRARPLYRDSKNPTSLRIDKETGQFADFSANIYGSFEELVKLTLGLKTMKEAKKWLSDKGMETIERTKPKITVEKHYPLSILDRLLPSYVFYTRKGIDTEILKLFKCGLATHGKMINRLVFPIINHNDPSKIIGFSGRDVLDIKLNKWKQLGIKSNWCYPLFLNRQDILNKDEIILVESIGDMLALWNAGITNSLVLFGIKIGKELKKQLLALDPSHIIIATNNDENNVGQNSSKQIAATLSSLMGKEKIQISLPEFKDLGVMSKQQILDWYNNAKR